MKRAAIPGVVLLLFLLAGMVLAQSGEGYDLNWNTVDGGGATRTTGGMHHVERPAGPGVERRRPDIDGLVQARQRARGPDAELAPGPGGGALLHHQLFPQGLRLLLVRLDRHLDLDIDDARVGVDVVGGGRRGGRLIVLGDDGHGHPDRGDEREQYRDEGAAGPRRHGTFLVLAGRGCAVL